MLGLELAAGYAAAWVWRKARRAAGALDADVDLALDSALERVHALVAAKLAGDPAFEALEQQAVSDPTQPTVKERTRQRVELALVDAGEADEGFARQLAALVEAVQKAEQAAAGAGSSTVRVTASGERSVAVGGNVTGNINTGDGLPNTQRP